MTADVPIVLLLIVLILLGCGVVMTREDRRLLRRDVRAVHRWTRRELAKPRLRLRIVHPSTTERDRRAHLNAIVRERR